MQEKARFIYSALSRPFLKEQVEQSGYLHILRVILSIFLTPAHIKINLLDFI